MFDGAQLAVDTTLVSPLHCDGSARPGAPSTDGVALSAARRRKERAYPELVGSHCRARLVVLASEVLQSASMLVSIKAREKEYEEFLSGQDNQVWKEMSEEWQQYLMEKEARPAV